MKSFKKFLALCFAIILATSVFSACKVGKVIYNKNNSSYSNSSSYSKSSYSSRKMTDEDIFVFNSNTITGLTDYGKTLFNITIPQKLNNITIDTIGANAFKGLDRLQSITFGKNITTLGQDAFKNIGDQFTTIYYNGTMDNWVDMYIYNGDANPLNYAENFYLNNQLVTEISITTASFISTNAFYGADFKKIIIGSSVNYIGNNAFYNCTSIEEVVWLGNVDSWAQINFANSYANPLYYAKRFYIDNELITDINLQNTTAISAYAFVNAPIKKLTLGDKVSSIGNSAFWGSKIVMATIGAGVETFGSNVFAYCKSLVEMYNKSSTEITADNTLIFGDYYSGAIKTQVLNIYTQESNSKISKDSNGFIVYNDGTSVILLGYEGQETYIRLPSNITSINANAFFGNNKLRSVSLGSSVSSVLEGAFSDCSELSSVNLSSSCQLIGRHAFKNCKNLFSITIPSSVEEIGSEAFYGCRLVFATFKITAGWKIYYTGNSYRETILEKDLYSETNAANLLITKYVSYVWINEQ